MGAEKRRSDRVMLTIPLVLAGTDAKDHEFKEDARTVTLNRHGARIQTGRPLRIGQTIRLINLIGHREAEFRVVGPVSPLTEKGGEWGVEYLDPRDNIWGIQFPPSAEGPEPRALLECRNCRTVTLMRLSLVEVDVLETSGILSKFCQTCEVVTPWGYAEKQLTMAGPPGEAALVADAQAQIRAAEKGAEQRRHRRVSLQLPTLIRDYYGGVEITRSENVSKGGFCFLSEKTYHVGQGVMVICPYDPEADNIEVPARIVRRRDIQASHRKIYGVRYDPATP